MSLPHCRLNFCWMSHSTLSFLFRCKIASLSNDTYQVQGDSHRIIINQSIPWKETDNKWSLSSCDIFVTNNETSYNEWAHPINVSTTHCHQWVYDMSVFQSTFISKVYLRGTIDLKSIYAPKEDGMRNRKQRNHTTSDLAHESLLRQLH